MNCSQQYVTAPHIRDPHSEVISPSIHSAGTSAKLLIRAAYLRCDTNNATGGSNSNTTARTDIIDDLPLYMNDNEIIVSNMPKNTPSSAPCLYTFLTSILQR